MEAELPAINDTFGGRYRLLGHLGRGGMGVVYRALDMVENRVVALKVVEPNLLSEPNIRDRFMREIRVLHHLDHANIVKIFEDGKAEDFYYFTMNVVSGPNLSTFVDPVDPLTVEQVLFFFGQVCSAIEHVHARGVVHRDLKPTNIIIQDSKTVMLLDFGLARLRNDAALTLPGQALGTAAYMAPEVGRGEEASIASDIYALGCIFFQLATGVLPFQGDHSVDVILRHQKEQPPPLRRFRPDAPEMMERAVARALAKDPRERYATALDFFKALGRREGDSSGSFDEIQDLDPQELNKAITTFAPSMSTKWSRIGSTDIPGAGVLGGWIVKSSPDYRFVCVGADAIEGPLLFDTQDNSWNRLGDHGSGRNVRTICWSRSGRVLSFANSSRMVLVDMTQNRCLARLDVSNHRPWSVILVPTTTGRPTPIAVGESGGAVAWKGWPDRVPAVFRVHRGVSRAIQLYPGGGFFVTGGLDSTLNFWKSRNFEQLNSIKIEHAAIWGLTYSRSGQFLAAASSNQEEPVLIFFTNNRRLEKQRAHIRGRALSVEFSQSERLLAVGGHEVISFLEQGPDGDWEMSEQVPVEGEVRSLSFGQADRTLYAVNSLGALLAFRRGGSRSSHRWEAPKLSEKMLQPGG